MRKKLLTAFVLPALFAASSAYAVPSNDLFPPNAKPGECYARLFVPPTFETISEDVVTQQATENITIEPAKYEWVEEKVMVQEASLKFEAVPASYKTVEELVEIKPASKKLVEVPAEYETVEERIIDKPAHTVWKKGRGPIEKVDNGTGEIMCLVEVPATYKTVTKKLVKSPASITEVDVPAEYQTITRKVVDQPATTKQIEIPAKFEMVKVQKLVQPEREVRVAVPQKSERITKTVKMSEGQMEWKPVLCETNMTPEVIKPLQQALINEGLYAGAVDGRIGRGTVDAIKTYQSKNNLASGGITLETIARLLNENDTVRAQLRN